VAAAAVALFIVFYPLLTGTDVEWEYAHGLCWFPTWQLIA